MKPKIDRHSGDPKTNRTRTISMVMTGTLLLASAFVFSSSNISNQQLAHAQEQTEQQQNQTQNSNATTIANTTVTDTFTANGIITGTIPQSRSSQQTATASNATQPANQTSNTTQTAGASSSPYLVGGDWTLDVDSGNVTNFRANFTMVRTDGSEHHSHDITNFRVGNNTQFQLDPAGKTTINGTADIAVNGTTRWPGVDTAITIEEARILTIEPQEQEAKKHFQDQPIYGIVLQATGANGTMIAQSAPAGGNQTQDEGILDQLTKPLEDLFK